MNAKLTIVSIFIIALFSISGCQTIAFSEGPIVSFVFTAAANPALNSDVVGSITKRGDPKTIRLAVPPGTGMRDLVATISVSAESTITVVSSGSRVVQQNGRTPNDFSVPVTYSIDVTGDKKPWTYQVFVREAETNPKLAALSIRGAQLYPAYLPEGISYEAEVQYKSQSVIIEAQGQSRYLRNISVADKPYNGNQAAVELPFAGDKMIVKVESLAEDGVSRMVYTVLVLRGEPDRNAYLEAINVAGEPLSPGFSFDQQSYRVTVPYEMTTLPLTASTQSLYAGLAVLLPGGKGATTADPTGRAPTLVDFSSGSRMSIVLQVTAQDGGQQRYRLEVLRAAPDANNVLSSLSVQGTQLIPAAGKGSLSYRLVLPYNTNEIHVTAIPQSDVATVSFERGKVALPFRGDPRVQPGALLSYSDTTPFFLSVLVIAQNGEVRRYTIQITKSAPDSNNNLGLLSISAGRLTPGFTPRTTNYNVAVPANNEKLVLTAEAASPYATISVLEESGIRPQRRQVLTFTLQPGERRTVNLVISAQSGVQKRYRVSMSRPGTPSATMKPSPAVAEVTDARPPEPGQAVQPTQQTEQQATQPAGEQSQTAVEPLPAPAPPQGQPAIGTTRVILEAKNLRLEDREAAAIGDAAISDEAMVILRYYRTEQVLDRQEVDVIVRKQGRAYSVTFDYSSPAITVETARLIEVEFAIEVDGGRFLHYSEASRYDATIEIEMPFLLYSASPRVTWPVIGTIRPVAGYVSLLPPGQDRGTRAADSADLEKNSRNEYGIDLSLTDVSTGSSFGTEKVWSKPGLARGHVFPFGGSISVPEGAEIGYQMAARARNGRMWQSAGITTAWTTKLRYQGGFEPIFLQLNDDLTDR